MEDEGAEKTGGVFCSNGKILFVLFYKHNTECGNLQQEEMIEFSYLLLQEIRKKNRFFSRQNTLSVYAPLRSVLNVYHWHTAPQRVGEDGSSLLDLEHRKDRMV